MTKNTVTSEMLNKSDESTNSGERPITLILFSSDRNLTRTELKKTFAVKKVSCIVLQKGTPLLQMYLTTFSLLGHQG